MILWSILCLGLLFIEAEEFMAEPPKHSIRL